MISRIRRQVSVSLFVCLLSVYLCLSVTVSVNLDQQRSPPDAVGAKHRAQRKPSAVGGGGVGVGRGSGGIFSDEHGGGCRQWQWQCRHQWRRHLRVSVSAVRTHDRSTAAPADSCCR